MKKEERKKNHHQVASVIKLNPHFSLSFTLFMVFCKQFLLRIHEPVNAQNQCIHPMKAEFAYHRKQKKKQQQKQQHIFIVSWIYVLCKNLSNKQHVRIPKKQTSIVRRTNISCGFWDFINALLLRQQQKHILFILICTEITIYQMIACCYWKLIKTEFAWRQRAY